MDSLNKNLGKEENLKTKKVKILESTSVVELDLGPTILLDSSFVLALLTPDDVNHRTVRSIFGFLGPYNCRFHIPLYVFAKVLSKIVHHEKKVSIATKILDDFVKNLPGVLFTGSNPNLQEIVDRYKKFARKDIKELQSNDFIIVSEGILSESIILTLDHEMYQKVKKYHNEIYYVATDSIKYKSDISKFAEMLLQRIKVKGNRHGT